MDGMMIDGWMDVQMDVTWMGVATGSFVVCDRRMDTQMDEFRRVDFCVGVCVRWMNGWMDEYIGEGVEKS